ncbi:S9 family peptidase [Paraliomyxa miuraensis]|uniref:S9 family peptidase n=1 Tax=Paraliomyxa miuraensis TaxID=376150 RepID=UPI0022557D40|nr:S9 family peptidase [Paraliomyxa miuraensis]MCX4247938.1 S9 family peptidase [Paraliomyxa miuraensis]
MSSSARGLGIWIAPWLAMLGCRPAPVDLPEPPPAVLDGPLMRGESHAVDGTADPAGGEPELVPTTYDPSADPRNRMGTGSGSGEPRGWDLAAKRAPDDPADAKKAPFSIEALYRLASVGAPVWSPDGKRLLFTVTHHDLAKGKSNGEIWLAEPTEAMTTRRLTRFEGYDGAPTWAPDGRSFAFVSSRGDEGNQLWRMSIDGGEPERLTSSSTGVDEPQWSPDGTRIAFVSRVFPEHGADDEANRAALEDVERSPIKAYLADELLERHWTHWEDGRRDHLLVLELRTGTITDVTPGEYDSPAFRLGDPGFSWSPDGQELCFSSVRVPGSAQAWSTNKDLYVVPVTGGPARSLTKDNPGFDGHPLYSPDGRFIAYRRQAKDGYESDEFELALYERKTGRARVLTGGFPNWVTEMRWSGSAHMVFQGPVEGRTPLLRVGVDGGAIERLGLPSAGAYDVAPDGRLAFTFSSVGRPVELYVADANGTHVQRLTGVNDAVALAYDIRPVEELRVPGADGKPVHVFVVKPHGFRKGKRYPLIVNVHGGPQSQWADTLRGDWQIYPGAGYVVAFFNPHGSTGYGQEYTAAISKDWNGKVYADVMAVVDALEREPYVDSKRIGAMGWSYGGYMMNWLLGHTDRFEAIASMMGIYDLSSFYGGTEELWFPEYDLGGPPWEHGPAYQQASPSTYAASFSTPTLVITGERDYRVPYTQSLDLFTALRRRDVPARLVVFPNDGHWPSHVRSMPLYYAAHLDWFHRYLGGRPSPYDLEAMIRGRAFDPGTPAKN